MKMVIFNHEGHAHSILPAGQDGEICTLSPNLDGDMRDDIARMFVSAPEMLDLIANITNPTDAQAVEKLLSFFNTRFPLMTRRNRVLVCGGREFENEKLLIAVLDKEINKPLDMIIHGGARGADLLAGEWADYRKVPVAEFRADWKLHGKAAGPIRNQMMLDHLRPDTDDFVIAFPGGAGTADMVKRAKRKKIPVIEVKE